MGPGATRHNQTFNVTAHVMIGFDLDPDTAYSLIANDYNPRCSPPWTEHELKHKIKSVAEKCTRPRGYLLETDRNPGPTPSPAPPQDDDPDAPTVSWTSNLIRNDKCVSGRAIRTCSRPNRRAHRVAGRSTP